MWLMILTMLCEILEDEKNQKILVGYGSLVETSVFFHHNPYFLATLPISLYIFFQSISRVFCVPQLSAPGLCHLNTDKFFLALK